MSDNFGFSQPADPIHARSEDWDETALPEGVEAVAVDPSPASDDDENTGSVLQDALEDAASYSEHDSLPGIEHELTALLNRYSAESVSGTPDYILAKFLVETLKSYNEAVSTRAEFRGESLDFSRNSQE